MGPIACISLRKFALQIAVRQGGGSHESLVLLPSDRPTSPVLDLTRSAQKAGIRIGMRYSEVLQIDKQVRATVVSDSQVSEAQAEIQALLSRWSPRWESSPLDAGTFWGNVAGLSSIFGTSRDWGLSVRADLRQQGFAAIVVVGWSRLGTYLLARHRHRSTIISTLEAESQALQDVRLDALPFSLRHRRLLHSLGVETWGTLQSLPEQELRKRLDSDLLKRFQSLRTLDAMPIQEIVLPIDLSLSVRFDYEVNDDASLLRALEVPLRQELATLSQRGRVLCQLTLRLHHETGLSTTQMIIPARPSTNFKSLFKLLTLRLEGIPIPSAITMVDLEWETTTDARSPGELFPMAVGRDSKRAEESLALIRARLGNEAVRRVKLSDKNSPDLAFQCGSFTHLVVPQIGPRKSALLHAIRRVSYEPNRVQKSVVGERIAGPFELLVVSEDRIVDREYWFLRRRSSEVHWVFWDKRDNQIGWQGVVD